MDKLFLLLVLLLTSMCKSTEKVSASVIAQTLEERYFRPSIRLLLHSSELYDDTRAKSDLSLVNRRHYKSGAISIEQYGKLIKPSNGVVVLDKAAFDIKFNFLKPMAVLVNASYNDKLLLLSSKGESLNNREEFDERNLMAVALFNPQKRIYVSDDASSPWFYMSNEEHNFNKVEIINGLYHCTRSINEIWDSNIESSFAIEHVEKPIHLTFVTDTNGEDMTDNVKLNFNQLKIEWKD